MPWRDAVSDAAAHDLIRQFAVAPLANWSTRVRWLLARQRHNLAHLLGSQSRYRTWAWRIRQPGGHTQVFQWYSPPGMPAASPQPDRFLVHGHLASNVHVAVAHRRQQHHPRTSDQRLPG